MVTVLLTGGLGNQMFQYAAGKALAMQLNVPLYIDLFYYTKKTQSTYRKFGLDLFETDLNFKSGIGSKLYVRYKLFLLRHPKLSLKMGFFSDKDALIYDPQFETLKNGIILAGYFQNEKYFKSVEQEIRAGFRFRNKLDNRNKQIAGSMALTNSVSVHIRRGDYVTDNKTSLKPCSPDYYKKALDKIRHKISDPSFFVFSDDMEWVKQKLNFGSSPVQYIDWNTGNSSYIDMQLMSLCKHNIIANSSFSWWGAWLNNNLEKTVIAPDEWFRGWFGSQMYPGYLPYEWIRI